MTGHSGLGVLPLHQTGGYQMPETTLGTSASWGCEVRSGSCDHPRARGGWGWFHSNLNKWAFHRKGSFYYQEHTGMWPWAPQTRKCPVHSSYLYTPRIPLLQIQCCITIVLLCGFVLKETDATFSVCSLGSSLNLYLGLSVAFGLCLCFHTGLPSLDTMLTLWILLNTVDSLSGGLFGFIMGTPGIKYLSSLSLLQWSTIPSSWPDQLGPPLSPLAFSVSQLDLTRCWQEMTPYSAKNLPTYGWTDPWPTHLFTSL